MNFIYLFLICFQITVFANFENIPHLSLDSHIKIKKKADEIQLKIHVITQADTAKDAVENNASKLCEIIKQLKENGLQDKEFETAQFQLNPIYTPYPEHPPKNWKPSIIGYEVQNSIYLHTGSFDLIGEWIDIATKCGADKISDIQFGLNDPEQYNQELLFLAGHQIRKDAETFARSLNVTLRRILSVSMNQSRISHQNLPLSFAAKSNHSTPIEAGDLTLESTAHVIYEIASY